MTTGGWFTRLCQGGGRQPGQCQATPGRGGGRGGAEKIVHYSVPAPPRRRLRLKIIVGRSRWRMEVCLSSSSSSSSSSSNNSSSSSSSSSSDNNSSNNSSNSNSDNNSSNSNSSTLALHQGKRLRVLHTPLDPAYPRPQTRTPQAPLIGPF